ncbi:ribosomal RNA processing protein 36 homolog [Syngnathus scovelli]|uniref:ribosomal RNA processing protein 36 homolog n=1 Tax=Syngnathus scovelli TaxID=161590 RepID=UPI00211042A8|nr:ribosomal RNA processing protein 36 homolog [Syngnathus scovelli]
MDGGTLFSNVGLKAQLVERVSPLEADAMADGRRGGHSHSLMLMARGRREAPDDEEDQVGSNEDEGDEDLVGPVGSDEEESDDEEYEEESDDEEEYEEESHDDKEGPHDEEAVEVQPTALRREEMKKDLSALPFEDVLKLQSCAGTKALDRVARGARPSCKRLNKNRPAEVSAKKRAPFLRQVVAVKKATARDPRFDDLSGEYKADIFDKTYSFIHDIRRHETQVIQKQLKKSKNADKKEQLNGLLRKMADRERARQSRERQRAGELQHKKEQRERAQRGHRPFFLSKSEQKKLRLADRFSALKTSGKLDAFMGKKRKRNAGKDRRKLPWRQQPGEQSTPRGGQRP